MGLIFTSPRLCPTCSSGLREVFQGEESFEIVAHADQDLFERDFGEPTQTEAPETEHFFDNPKDGFDGLIAQFVELPAGFCFQPMSHPPFGARRRAGYRWLGLRQQIGYRFMMG